MVVSIAAVTEQEIRNALETEWKDLSQGIPGTMKELTSVDKKQG